MRLSLFFTLSLLPGFLSAADWECETSPLSHPADRAEWAVETGYLWNLGDNTPIDYEIVPTQLVYRSPAMLDWFTGSDGSRLVVRNRFALLTEAIVEGPEDYYLGLSAAPSIEYWFPNRQTSAYFSIGGGIGLTNSTDVPGGQGQDFTLNWFTQLGLRQEITRGFSLLGGIYFLHHSNGGQTSPNPGIDALGFTVGAGWTF